MPGLGLGVGFNPQQQQGFRRAIGQGTATDWLGQHQGAAGKIRRAGVAAGNTPQAQNYTNLMLQNSQNAQRNAQANQPAAAAPPQGNAATGSSKGGGGGAAAAPAPAAAAPPATPAPDSTYQGTLNTQFGAGQPFGMQDWYGENPLETATNLANRNLSKQLADVRARYAGSGGGTSGREALAEGTAVGESTTGLGDVMAQRGLQARQADVQAGLQAMLGAGSQQLQGQQNQMNYATGMGNMGNMINQIGALEQQVPNAALIQQLLGMFSQQTGTSATKQKQKTQSGFLGM